MKAHLFYALAATTLLIGCSTTPNLTKAECDALNWQQLGAQDGAKGDTKEQLNRHQEACATHGVQPDTAAYQAGLAQGIEQYCVYKNGLATGQNGEEFNSACAEDRYILFGSG